MVLIISQVSWLVPCAMLGIGDEVWDVIDILNGIFQGSTVGQTFFSVYINDVLKVLQHLIGFLLADDLQGMLEVTLEDLKRDISLANSDELAWFAI